MSKTLGKKGIAWASLEWARNPFYILVVIYIFVPYFASEIIGSDILASEKLEGLDAATAQQTANAGGQAAVASITKWAGLVAAFTAPFLGAALDRGGRRKPVMAGIFGAMAIASWLLWFAIPGSAGLSTALVMLCLVIGYLGFAYSEVTHNAMLSVAGKPSKLPMLSGLGLALGSLAGTLILVALACFFALPAAIGWPFSEAQFGVNLETFEHMRIAGPLSAVWIIAFSIPFFLYAEDGGTKGASWIQAIKDGAKAVFKTIREARKYPQIAKFLVSRMFFIDAVAALLSLGAVYVALFLEWGFLEMTVFGISASAWGFAGGLVGGSLDTKFGPKRALIIEITCMMLILILQLSITKDAILFGAIDNYQVWDGPIFNSLSDCVYLALASVVMIAATACIASSRSMMVTLAPADRSGEFFGLYAIAGTVTVWLGPLLIEVFTTVFNSQRIGMVSIAGLFLIGLLILTRVKMEDAS